MNEEEIEIEYHENGNIKKKLVGDRLSLYHETGRQYAEGTFRNGYMEDYWVFESNSGQTYIVGKLKKNIQTGSWTIFNRKGEPLHRDVYKNGVIVPPKKWQTYLRHLLAVFLFEIINIDFFIEKFSKKTKGKDEG
jgi:antitoxin component YwqK of YwqJK toxin-antitoxin module